MLGFRLVLNIFSCSILCIKLHRNKYLGLCVNREHHTYYVSTYMYQTLLVLCDQIPMHDSAVHQELVDCRKVQALRVQLMLNLLPAIAVHGVGTCAHMHAPVSTTTLIGMDEPWDGKDARQSQSTALSCIADHRWTPAGSKSSQIHPPYQPLRLACCMFTVFFLALCLPRLYPARTSVVPGLHEL